MIESKNKASRNLEKALQKLKQAKQRVGNKKKCKAEKPFPHKPLSQMLKMKAGGGTE